MNAMLIDLSQCMNPGSTLPQFTMPSGAIAGDFAYVYISSAQPCTCPTGWTLLATDYNAQSVFYRWVVGGDAGTVFTFGSAAGANGYIKVWRNVAQLGNATFNESALAAPSVSVQAGDVTDYAWWTQGNTADSTFELANAGGTALDGEYEGSYLVANAVTTANLQNPSVGYSPTETATGTYSAGAASGSGACTVYLPANAVPAAPILVSPANGAFIDLTQAQQLTWQQVAGQTGFSIARTLGATTEYWIGDEWAGGDSDVEYNSGSQNSLPFAANALGTNGNAYTWEVYVWTAGGESPASVPFSFTGEAAPTVDVTGPTGTETTSAPTATWTDSLPEGLSQTTFRAVVYTAAQVAEATFLPGVSTAEWDSGVVAGTALTEVLGPLPMNGSTSLYVQINDGHQLSAWASITWTQEVPPPPIPSLTVTPNSSGGYIEVAVTNPEPSGDEVATLYNDIFRYNTANGPTTAIRIATTVLPNATWQDFSVASGTDYTYQAVAISAEGTTTDGAWQD